MNSKLIPIASATAIALLVVPGIAWSIDASPRNGIVIAQQESQESEDSRAACEAEALHRGLSAEEAERLCAETDASAEAPPDEQAQEPPPQAEPQADQQQPAGAAEPEPAVADREACEATARQHGLSEEEINRRCAEPDAQAGETAPAEQAQEPPPQAPEGEGTEQAQQPASEPEPRADQQQPAGAAEPEPAVADREACEATARQHGLSEEEIDRRCAEPDAQAASDEQQPSTESAPPPPAGVTVEGEVEEIKPVQRETVETRDGHQVRAQTFSTNEGLQIEKEITEQPNGDKVVVTRTTERDGRVVVRERVIERAPEDQVVARELWLDGRDRREGRDWRDGRDGRRDGRDRRRDRRDRGDIRIIINVPVGMTIPVERYVVPAYAPLPLIRETLLAPPVIPVERIYSIQEVTQSERLRTAMPRIDLDTITFGFDQAFIPRDQLNRLDDIGQTMAEIVDGRPNEVFLLEGHTDAVGSSLYNLQLSELRAYSVKTALVGRYGIPEENLVTEGYGEEFLKIPTQEEERLNRRVTVRRITPLVQR